MHLLRRKPKVKRVGFTISARQMRQLDLYLSARKSAVILKNLDNGEVKIMDPDKWEVVRI